MKLGKLTKIVAVEELEDLFYADEDDELTAGNLNMTFEGIFKSKLNHFDT